MKSAQLFLFYLSLIFYPNLPLVGLETHFPFDSIQISKLQVVEVQNSAKTAWKDSLIYLATATLSPKDAKELYRRIFDASSYSKGDNGQLILPYLELNFFYGGIISENVLVKLATRSFNPSFVVKAQEKGFFAKHHPISLKPISQEFSRHLKELFLEYKILYLEDYFH